MVAQETLLQQSDIVSLHLPAVPQTSGMVNSRYFLPPADEERRLPDQHLKGRTGRRRGALCGT